MLSSRYLHLHEALGLGPMWLKKGAKVLPAVSSQQLTENTEQPSVLPQKPAIQAPSSAAKPNQARLAAITAAKVSVSNSQITSDGYPVSDKPSEKITPQSKSIAVLPPKNEITPSTRSLIDKIQPATVMIISVCPSLEDNISEQFFSGDAGTLLDNMLITIGLNPTDTHKTCWIKEATFDYNPPIEYIRTELPQIHAELSASQAKAVVFLGQFFEQSKPAHIITELCLELPYFSIPHPARLLRQPQLKAQAWIELKKLWQVLQN